MQQARIRSVTARIISMIGIVTLSSLLGACNTMHGMGKDVERGGEHIEDAATKVQNKM